MTFENKTTIARTSFCGLLTIVFIVLKLCGVIKWSWLWVLSPLWLSVVICILGFIIFVIVKAIRKEL